MSRLRNLPAVVAAGLLLLGCQPSAESSELVVDFRVGEERGEILATIDDETRYLLAEVPHGVVLASAMYEIPRDGVLSFERRLPPALRAADGVVVAAKASRDGRSWHNLAPVIGRLRDDDGKRNVAARLEFPSGWRGQGVRVQAFGWSPPADGRISTRSAPFEVPRGAVLEAGAGVLEVGRGGGDIVFSIEACAAGTCRALHEATVRGDADRWKDWRVSLADWSGQTIELKFEAGFVDRSPARPMFGVWSRPRVLVPRKNDKPTNLVLLSIDTLRADYLSSYGHQRDTAPKTREWFESRGVLFENAIAAATTTGPSHMTMFTSLTPTVHGITDRPGVRRPPPLTLAELLRARGYATGAVTEDGPLHALWGFSRGFDSYAENKSSDVMLPEGHVAATFARGEGWLRRNADRPFFLFLHTFEVHYPYTPPSRYAASFGSPERPAGVPPDYAPVLYEREILHVDEQLDAFMQKLEKAGLLEDTLFVVTSDHGEEFLEHGAIGHGPYLHKEVLHVPLLVRGPSVRQAVRIAEPVGHLDLVPTILDLLGLPPLDVAMGRNLGPLLRGEGAGVTEAPIYSEAWYATAMGAGGATHRVEQPSIAVRSGRRKLVRTFDDIGFAFAYYDLSSDPDERVDLFAERAEEVEDLRQLLVGYEPLMKGLRRRAVAARQRFSSNPAQGRESAPEIDPAVHEKLRALGYVE